MYGQGKQLYITWSERGQDFMYRLWLDSLQDLKDTLRILVKDSDSLVPKDAFKDAKSEYEQLKLPIKMFLSKIN